MIELGDLTRKLYALVGTGKGKLMARPMRHGILVILLLVLGFTGVACSTQAPRPTATPTAPVDIEATVTAAVAAALARSMPTPNLDIEATVEARVQATVEAMPSPTPTFIPTPSPSPTSAPIPATPDPTATPTPLAAVQVENTVNSNPYQVIQQSVVKITSRTSRGTALGSGVIVGRGYHVITNAHVIDGAVGNIEVSIHPEGGPSVVTTGQVVFRSENIDLALIKLANNLGEPIDVSRSLPALGDTLILGGFPGIGGETLTATRGTVAGFDRDGAVIKFDGQIGRGSSGGAAVNEEGKLVAIATAFSGEPSGGNLGLLLSLPLVAHTLARALLEDSRADAELVDSQYSLGVIGIPAVATVPQGWRLVVNFGYFDIRAPGTETAGLNEDYHVVGIFISDFVADEAPESILDRIVDESEGGFEVVPNSQIKPPPGFSKCTLLHNVKRFDMSAFQARGSVIGNGWISVAGLYTRFCVGQSGKGTVIGYVESPSREVATEDGQWLSSSVTILSD